MKLPKLSKKLFLSLIVIVASVIAYLVYVYSIAFIESRKEVLNTDAPPSFSFPSNLSRRIVRLENEDIVWSYMPFQGTVKGYGEENGLDILLLAMFSRD